MYLEILYIVVIVVAIFWLVQIIIIDDVLWGSLITALIVFFFVDINPYKKTVGLKTETEIKQKIDVARDAAVTGVEKIHKIYEEEKMK